MSDFHFERRVFIGTSHLLAFFHRNQILEQLKLGRIQFKQKSLFLSCVPQLVCMLNNCNKKTSISPWCFKLKQATRPKKITAELQIHNLIRGALYNYEYSPLFSNASHVTASKYRAPNIRLSSFFGGKRTRFKIGQMLLSAYAI